MSMKAQFNSKCTVCGIEIKKGTIIHKLNEHWCSNLECGQKKKSSGPPEPMTEHDKTGFNPKDQTTLAQKGRVAGSKPQAKEYKTSKIPTEENSIEPQSPHQEAELIDRWAKNTAYKITMQDYADFDALSKDEKYQLRIETNMREKILVNAVIRLYEIWGIKK